MNRANVLSKIHTPASFQEKLASAGLTLRKRKIEVLQVNLGKLCNMTCSHCHVEAGPSKTKENMSAQTARQVVRLMDVLAPATVDLTGGAPEMNPQFRFLVMEARSRGLRVIDRCNLTVLLEPGHEDLAAFLADHQVEVIASLPCYSRENVDKQRGRGAFDKSLQALKILNDFGYGKPESDLVLSLVYNPVGPHLPPDQARLEADYKARLSTDYGILFSRLYTITNMPITRYAKYLKALNQYDEYVALLANAFNPSTVEGLMCRDTLSMSWQGKLYDCDFNQMLELEMKNPKGLSLETLTQRELKDLEIQTAAHCFGCTAGAGSSCQGALE